MSFYSRVPPRQIRRNCSGYLRMTLRYASCYLDVERNMQPRVRGRHIAESLLTSLDCFRHAFVSDATSHVFSPSFHHHNDSNQTTSRPRYEHNLNFARSLCNAVPKCHHRCPDHYKREGTTTASASPEVYI